MKKINKKIKKLLSLSQKAAKLRPLSSVEKKFVEAEERFEATYYSNRLEGNKLSKSEARKAVLAE